MWIFSVELQLKTSRGKPLHSTWKTESSEKHKSGWLIILKSKFGGWGRGLKRTVPKAEGGIVLIGKLPLSERVAPCRNLASLMGQLESKWGTLPPAWTSSPCWLPGQGKQGSAPALDAGGLGCTAHEPDDSTESMGSLNPSFGHI